MSVNIDVPDAVAQQHLQGSMAGAAAAKGSAGSFTFDWQSLSAVRVPAVGEVVATVQQHMRPWTLFAAPANFRTPTASLPRLYARLLTNVTYFRCNYVLVASVLMLYCLLTSPLLLIVMAAGAYGQIRARRAAADTTTVQLFNQSVVLTPTHRSALVAIVTAPFLYLVGAGAALFWVLGATCVFVGGHATFYNADTIRGNDDSDGGFLLETV